MGASTYSSMFITKFSDVAGMAWPTDIGCTTIHQRDGDVTVFNAYNMGGPSFGGDSIDSHAAGYIALTSAASVPNYSPTQAQYEVYLKSPDQLAVYYDSGASKATMDLKFSYSASCSVWARPSTVALTSKIGTTDGYSVAHDPYTLT